MITMSEEIRVFKTWSSRDTANWKYEFCRYINPINEFSFAKYMQSKQTINGEYRRWDNRQKWIPEESLFDSLTRHIRCLELLRWWYDVYEINYRWAVRREVVPQWDILVILDDIESKVNKKDIISELNAIRFNSEAMKLQHINWNLIIES